MFYYVYIYIIIYYLIYYMLFTIYYAMWLCVYIYTYMCVCTYTFIYWYIYICIQCVVLIFPTGCRQEKQRWNGGLGLFLLNTGPPGVYFFYWAIRGGTAQSHSLRVWHVSHLSCSLAFLCSHARNRTFSSNCYRSAHNWMILSRTCMVERRDTWIKRTGDITRTWCNLILSNR